MSDKAEIERLKNELEAHKLILMALVFDSSLRTVHYDLRVNSSCDLLRKALVEERYSPDVIAACKSLLKEFNELIKKI